LIPHKLSNLKEEAEVFRIITQNLFLLASLYYKEDPTNLKKIHDSGMILREVIDSRLLKLDPSIRNGIE